MIITISGKPGSGKSTIAKTIAKEMGLKHYSMGGLQREIAKEKGITIVELGKLEEQDDEIDKEIEKKQENLGKNEDDFIIDSRLGYHFIPNSIKIFLDVDEEEAAKRIMSDKRDEENFKDLESAKKTIRERIDSEVKRFKEYYDIDFGKKEYYDLFIDTTRIDSEKVAEKILNFIKGK